MASPGIALVAGLGNPGARYAATRHNAGAQFIARWREADGFELGYEKKFQAEVGNVARAGRKVRVTVPATFMNLSARAVAPLAAFYRIAPAEILVVHDELDLAPGVARLKRGGGHGGHNGLRDLSARIGRDYARLRIGIGHPGAGRDVSGYVLGKPSAHERALIDDAIERALVALDDIIGGDFEAAMLRLHTVADTGNANTAGAGDGL